MKKFISSYGVLFLYIGLSFGFDLILNYWKLNPTPEFDIEPYHILYRLFWIFFPIGTFLYLWSEFIKQPRNYISYWIMGLIGLLGIILNLCVFAPTLYEYPLKITVRIMIFFGFARTAGLEMAMIFIGMVGVRGLFKKGKLRKFN